MRTTAYIVFAMVVASLGLVSACQEEGEPDLEEPVVDEVVDEESGDEEETLDRAFGLPVPPDASTIYEGDTRVRVATDMDLGELEEFFIEHVVDIEVVVDGGRLDTVPLRPHSPTADARHQSRSDTDSPVVINYRPPTDPAKEDRQILPIGGEEDDDEDGAEAVSSHSANTPGQRPDWLDDAKGEPVELRTDDGELLAPEAKWGEPYTPPEGSPLDDPRFEHNYGRDFGDWR